MYASLVTLKHIYFVVCKLRSLVVMLIVNYFVKEWEEDKITHLVQKCRQMNSLEYTLPMFNTAMICSELSQVNNADTAADRCFDHVQHLYFNDDTPLSGIYTCRKVYIISHMYKIYLCYICIYCICTIHVLYYVHA